MKTMQEWTESQLSFNDFVEQEDEVDGDIYHYFLGNSYPVLKNTGKSYEIFLCGEIACFKKGSPAYDGFVFNKLLKTYSYVGSLSVDEANRILTD